MRVTQWGEYGILCSVYLARRHSAGELTVGAAEIAKAQGIDIQYAQQILQRLRKGEIIESARGPQGGYKLLRPARETTLYQVLCAAEGDTFEVICETKPLNPARCSDDSFCSLRELWNSFREHVNSFLLNRTIQDLIDREDEVNSPIQIGHKHLESTAN